MNNDLENFVMEQHNFYMLLFSLIIGSDEQLKKNIAEAIRKILQTNNASYQISDAVQYQLRSFRDTLLKPISKSLAEEMSPPGATSKVVHVGWADIRKPNNSNNPTKTPCATGAPIPQAEHISSL